MYRTINSAYAARQMFPIIKLNIKEGSLCTFGANRLSNYREIKGCLRPQSKIKLQKDELC